jgi:hypothetical protein
MYTMKLGELIAALERKNQDMEVRFEFARMFPTTIKSWRGDYSQLAIGYADTAKEEVTVGDLLKKLKEADGKTYDGYKGGNYLMSANTFVWVDNWGKFTETGILDINEFDGEVFIRTGHVRY